MKQYLLQFYKDISKAAELEFLTPCIEDDKVLSKMKQSFIKNGNFITCKQSLLNDNECVNLQKTRQNDGKAYLLSLTIDEAYTLLEIQNFNDENE